MKTRDFDGELFAASLIGAMSTVAVFVLLAFYALSYAGGGLNGLF